MDTHEFEIDEYSVGHGWSAELKNRFRYLTFNSTRPLVGKPKYLGTLYFFLENEWSRPIPRGGIRESEGQFIIIMTLHLEDFDGFYAMFRSERPLFFRVSEDTKGSSGINFLEIHSNAEPVGEVDSSPRKIIIGSGIEIGHLDDLFKDTP
jgi:hypothetical protein